MLADAARPLAGPRPYQQPGRMTAIATPVESLRLSPTTVAWREPGLLQVGLGEGSFCLADAPPEAPAIIAALTRGRSPGEVRDLFPLVDATILQRLVEVVESRGCLTADPLPAEVGLIGSGRLAQAIVRLLAPEASVWVADTSPRGARSALPARRERWRAHAGGAPLRFADHWHAALALPADVVIVCPDTIEADRLQTDQLTRQGRAHLVVTAQAERAIVGPFVVPGSTACIQCRDLARPDRREWGRFAARLAHTRSPASPLLRQWAAAAAVAQVRAFLGGGVPDTAGGTLELTAGGVLESGRWGIHEGCPCAGDW